MTRSPGDYEAIAAAVVAGGVPVAQGANEAAREPLTVYPKHPTADDVYYIGGAWAPACITAEDKRFTDAELAAEVWCITAEHWRSMANDQLRQSEYDRLLWIRKFAALPHYDEDES